MTFIRRKLAVRCEVRTANAIMMVAELPCIYSVHRCGISQFAVDRHLRAPMGDDSHLRLRASRGRQVHGHADCSSASLQRAAARVTVCSEAAAGTSRAGSHGQGRLQRQRMRHTKAVYSAVTPTNSATAAHRRTLCRCSDGTGSLGAAAWWCAGSSGCSSGAAVLSRCSGIAVESPYLCQAGGSSLCATSRVPARRPRCVADAHLRSRESRSRRGACMSRGSDIYDAQDRPADGLLVD